MKELLYIKNEYRSASDCDLITALIAIGHAGLCKAKIVLHFDGALAACLFDDAEDLLHILLVYTNEKSGATVPEQSACRSELCSGETISDDLVCQCRNIIILNDSDKKFHDIYLLVRTF